MIYDVEIHNIEESNEYSILYTIKMRFEEKGIYYYAEMLYDKIDSEISFSIGYWEENEKDYDLDNELSKEIFDQLLELPEFRLRHVVRPIQLIL